MCLTPIRSSALTKSSATVCDITTSHANPRDPPSGENAKYHNLSRSSCVLRYPMSLRVYEPTSRQIRPLSALAQKADIVQRGGDVRFVPMGGCSDLTHTTRGTIKPNPAITSSSKITLRNTASLSFP